MYCVKPLDEETLLKAVKNVRAVLTVEEHSPFGGLGSMVAQVIGRNCPQNGVEHGSARRAGNHRNIPGGV